MRTLSFSVDETGVAARVAKIWSRSIKAASQRTALDLIVAMTDLTTLEGNDTPGKVAALCHKAVMPDTEDPSCPQVAAVCVHGDLVRSARGVLGGLGSRGRLVRVASVAGAFPSGRADEMTRLDDVRNAVVSGADEIDMVIDRGALLAGRYDEVRAGVSATVDVAGRIPVKAILETGELGSLSAVRLAAELAMEGGAHFIKTSTGKISTSATPGAVCVMLEAARDFTSRTGRQVGVKAAGGIRTAKDAVRYLALVAETVGEDWLTPDWFRFGASSLLNDVLMQRRHLATGIYQGPDYFSTS